MFDQLIESDSQGADFGNRSRYFTVTTIGIGILFVTAVIYSLYAQDIDLGSEELELAAILAPVTPEVSEPPEARRLINRQENMPNRHDNVLRPDENPIVPAAISLVPNIRTARPPSDFTVGPGMETGSAIPGTGEPGSGIGNPEGSGSETPDSPAASPEKLPERPPAIKAVRPPTQSLGVINGRAAFLPKPAYPAAAIAVNAQGDVSVQVTISEEGKVISSKAINGHPLLRAAAEKAAWNAKFTPTLLSKVPVKVTGVIVYKFSRN